MASIRLTTAGIALFQHRGGAVKVRAAGEQFEPLEGEWLRLPLPNEIAIHTDNDTDTLDFILLEEPVR